MGRLGSQTQDGGMRWSRKLVASVLPLVVLLPWRRSPRRPWPLQPRHCAAQEAIVVPGAERQKHACLDDLTTAGTVASGHTNVDDWSGLHATGTTNPSGVPGIQVDGYFPDRSTTNTNNGWNHDSQFVIRLPDRWNGKLVVSGAPGSPAAVRQRLHHLRLGARARLRVRLDRQGQQRRLVPPGRRRDRAARCASGTAG